MCQIDAGECLACDKPLCENFRPNTCECDDCLEGFQVWAVGATAIRVNCSRFHKDPNCIMLVVCKGLALRRRQRVINKALETIVNSHHCSRRF